MIFFCRGDAAGVLRRFVIGCSAEGPPDAPLRPGVVVAPFQSLAPCFTIRDRPRAAFSTPMGFDEQARWQSSAWQPAQLRGCGIKIAVAANIDQRAEPRDGMPTALPILGVITHYGGPWAARNARVLTCELPFRWT